MIKNKNVMFLLCMMTCCIISAMDVSEKNGLSILPEHRECIVYMLVADKDEDLAIITKSCTESPLNSFSCGMNVLLY